MSVYFAKRGIFLNYFVRKFGSLIIVRIFGQAKEQNTMTTAQAISNEAYLKISNLSDLSDFNYAINRLKEITSMYGETKQSGLLMGRLIIKRDKLQ